MAYAHAPRRHFHQVHLTSPRVPVLRQTPFSRHKAHGRPRAEGRRQEGEGINGPYPAQLRAKGEGGAADVIGEERLGQRRVGHVVIDAVVNVVALAGRPLPIHAAPSAARRPPGTEAATTRGSGSNARCHTCGEQLRPHMTRHQQKRV